MASIDLDAKRASIEKVTKLVVAGVVCAVVGSYAYLILEGLMAIAAVGGALVLSWGLGPSIATYVANKRIALLKAAIEANPIETMENLEQDKITELAQQRKAVEEVGTQVRNVDTLVTNLSKSDPDEAKDYIEIRDKLKEGYEEVSNEYNDAETELAAFHKQIDKARRIWKVQTAINKALDVSAAARSAVFADIKKQVAFDKVTNDLNRAFARLDVAVQKRKGIAPAPTVKELPAPNVAVIDLGNVKAGEKVTFKG